MFTQTFNLNDMHFYDSMSSLCYTVTVHFNEAGQKKHGWKEMLGMFATKASRKYMEGRRYELYDFEFIPIDRIGEFHSAQVFDSLEKPDFTFMLKITEIERIEVHVNQDATGKHG